MTFGFLLTVWSSSGAMTSIITTLNAAYDISEGRPWWHVRLLAIGLTIGISFFILTSMCLVLVGPALGERVADWLELGTAFKWAWLVVQWPVVLVLVTTAIGLIYYFAPDAEQDWIWITPGSILATVLWLLVSLLFKLYITFFGNYNQTYGSIGAVIVLLTWLYMSSLAILLGAELNSEIEHASPHGKDVGEKVAGEKKRIGPAAERFYRERAEAGKVDVQALPDGVNCDVDWNEGKSVPRSDGLRPSDVLIGSAVLLPSLVVLGREIRKTLQR